MLIDHWLSHVKARKIIVNTAVAEAMTQRLDIVQFLHFQRSDFRFFLQEALPNEPELGVPALGPGGPTPQTKRNGTMAFYEIDEVLSGPLANNKWLEEIQGEAMLYNNMHVAYDSVRSVTVKV